MNLYKSLNKTYGVLSSKLNSKNVILNNEYELIYIRNDLNKDITICEINIKSPLSVDLSDVSSEDLLSDDYIINVNDFNNKNLFINKILNPQETISILLKINNNEVFEYSKYNLTIEVLYI